MKWIGQNIWSFISRFRSDVYLESLDITTETNVLVVDSNGKVSKSTSVAAAASATAAGIIETANTAETTAGTDFIRAVTPKGLAQGYEGTSVIDTVGTISSGTWNGVAIATSYIADDAVTEDKLANTLLAEIDANTAKATNATHTGDVTGSGALTIAADAVTYAKMQNVSATNVVLGRDSAGAGIVEEISAANLRTIINVEDGATADQTQADINGLAITTVGTIGTGIWQGTTIKTAYIGDDQITEDKLADTLLAEIDANTAKATNVSTNLTYTTASDQMTINSSDGDNVVISEASGSIAGVMTVAHHDKLDSIEDSATADQTKSDIDGLGVTTVGALSSGTIASGFGNIDNGTSTLDTGLATVGDLHVSVAGQATLDLIDTGGQTYQIFARNSDDVFGLYDGTNTQTFFRYTGHATPASTKLALLEAGGKVGIGTASPSQALDVSGNVNISGTIELGNATDTTLNRVSAGVVSIEGAHVKTQSLTIKVFPNQFINNDDTGRPVFLEDDTSNTLAVRGHSTGDDFYAFVEIPPLHKVTHVQVHASANTSSAVSVRSFNYQTGADNAISATTANFNQNTAVTNIPATATQDLVIKCTPGANTVLVYGATVTLALI